MKKYGVFFGNWKGTEDEAEFVGTEAECDKYYDEHIDNLDPDEYYEVKEV